MSVALLAAGLAARAVSDAFTGSRTMLPAVVSG